MSHFDEETLRRLEESIPFNRLLGIRCESARDGRAVMTLPVRQDFIGDPRRPALHGGVLSTLIDAAGGLAAWSGLHLDEAVSTVDLRIDFLEPARAKGILRAEAELIRKGNRVCHVQIVLLQAETRVAEGRGVYSIHRGKLGAG